MERRAYDAWTAALEERLAGDERVIGLVALGSMAAVDYQPDWWSDHDFFVIVHDPFAEAMRTDVGWLPEPERIVFVLRETAHGDKVLYDDGHLVEFAVFSLAEMAVAQAGRSRVLIDRGGVAEALAAISGQIRPDGGVDLRFELGMMAANVLVGVGRHRRGELLSGHQFVAGHAVDHLLRALTTLPSPHRALLDGLDVRRRVDTVHPEPTARIAALLALPVPAMGAGLLALADAWFGDRVGPDVRAALGVVDRAIRQPDEG